MRTIDFLKVVFNWVIKTRNAWNNCYKSRSFANSSALNA